MGAQRHFGHAAMPWKQGVGENETCGGVQDRSECLGEGGESGRNRIESGIESDKLTSEGKTNHQVPGIGVCYLKSWLAFWLPALLKISVSKISNQFFYSIIHLVKASILYGSYAICILNHFFSPNMAMAIITIDFLSTFLVYYSFTLGPGTEQM